MTKGPGAPQFKSLTIHIRKTCKKFKSFVLKVAIPGRATERGTEGYNDPGAHGLQEGRWLQWAQQRAHEIERGPSKWHWEISIWSLKTFFFVPGDHLVLTEKTVRISVKAFFFLRSHHNSDKTAAFFPSVLEITKPELRHIWAGPGPS